eukprot:EC849869.1.p2 GENE.EC849869.1~~EC849869.1.p2  ORF type:complete len:86 (-),score=20.67 EC849869.1:3-260(-)
MQQEMGKNKNKQCVERRASKAVKRKRRKKKTVAKKAFKCIKEAATILSEKCTNVGVHGRWVRRRIVALHWLSVAIKENLLKVPRP